MIETDGGRDGLAEADGMSALGACRMTLFVRGGCGLLWAGEAEN